MGSLVGLGMHIAAIGVSVRDRLRDHASRVRWKRVLSAWMIAVCICGLAFLESVRLAVWEGGLGIAEVSVQVFAAGMAFVIIVEIALWWAVRQGKQDA